MNLLTSSHLNFAHPLARQVEIRLFRTDTPLALAALTKSADNFRILAVEPITSTLVAVAIIPRTSKTPIHPNCHLFSVRTTPPDADDSTHSKTTPDTDSDTAPNAPSDHPVAWDSNPSETTPKTPSDPLQKYPFITPSQDPETASISSPSEQSLQAIHRAETTDFDHGFTKPTPTQPQADLNDDDLPPPSADDSDASSDSAPDEQPLPSAALQSDDSSVD